MRKVFISIIIYLALALTGYALAGMLDQMRFGMNPHFYHAVSGGDKLLMESGDNLLLESGDNILLE